MKVRPVRISRGGGTAVNMGELEGTIACRQRIADAAGYLIAKFGGPGEVVELVESRLDPGVYYTAVYRQDSTGASAEFSVKVFEERIV